MAKETVRMSRVFLHKVKYWIRQVAMPMAVALPLCCCVGPEAQPSAAPPDGHYRKTVDSLIAEGDSYYSKGFYANSLNSFTEALKLAERDSLTSSLPLIYNNIGSVYCTWCHDQLGIEYFKKGLRMPGIKQQGQTYRKLLMNVQGAAFNLGDMTLMRTYYDEMSGLSPADPVLQYFMYQNRGLLLRGEGKAQEALAWFSKAADYAEDKGLDPLLSSSAYGYLAEYYETVSPATALAYWQKSIESEGVPPFFRRDALRHLSSVSERLGLDSEAVGYARQYLELTDSLFKESDMNRARDAQVLYERELDQGKIQRLDQANRERDERIRAQVRVIAASLGAAVVLGLLFLFIYVQKRRLRQSYESLFERNRDILQMQEIDRRQRQALERRIEELERDGMPNRDTQDSVLEPRRGQKLHSVDKLTEERRREILSAIEQVMDETCVICEADFSIERLADLTGVNSRYLSQVINDTYGKNFRTLLNERRIREVQRRLLDTENWGNYTIQAIVQSVGYKSQSNFNQLFKKHTGVTPSMYHKMAREGRGMTPAEQDEE